MPSGESSLLNQIRQASGALEAARGSITIQNLAAASRASGSEVLAMSVERYEIKLASQRVAAVDLADAPDEAARFAVISNALRQLGASPITKRTFVLPAADKCSIADLQNILGDLFRSGDQMLVVGDFGHGITGTALVCPNTTEGVSVRKPPAGQGNDNGNPCFEVRLFIQFAIN